MDFRFSPEDNAFRQELQDFLRQELPPNWEIGSMMAEEVDWDFNLKMRKKLAERGWLTMHWPKEYGGQNASPVRTAIFYEEMSYNRAPGRDIFGVRMIAPVLMLYGSEEQKKEFLLPISRGEGLWCQGYSEPESGSDLASLQTRAVSDGDDYIINGSKIWTTMAHYAEWIFMLCRTDPEAPKHKGISFLVANLKTPGVTIRPVHQIDGVHHFNQVFFDNVRVPKKNLIGEENRGWYVAMSLLDFERSAMEYSANSRRLIKELVEYVKTAKANGKPLSSNSRVRNAIIDRHIEAETARLLAYKVAWMQGEGGSPNKEASINKIFGSETVKRTSETALEVLGLSGPLLPGSKWAKLNGRVPSLWVFHIPNSIASGTNEIQRNIVSTRGLGLPRG